MDEMLPSENLFDSNDYQQYPCTTEEIYHRCRIICTVDDCLHLVETIFDCFKVIVVDIQGRNIDTGGPISLLILATSNCWCFLIDLYVCPEMMFEGGLSNIFECVKLVKVIHKSRLFKNVLENHYKLYTRNIFDTQVAFRTIEAMKNNCIPQYIEPVPLQTISNTFGRHMIVASDYDIHCLITHIPNLWEYRPLILRACELVARNVLSLLPEAYVRMILEIKPQYLGVYIQMMHNFTQGINPISRPCAVDICIGEQHPCLLKKLQKQIDDIFEQKLKHLCTCRNEEENYPNICCSCNEYLIYNRKDINSEPSLCSCKMLRCKCMCQNSTLNCLKNPQIQHLRSPRCQSFSYILPEENVSPFSSKLSPKFQPGNKPISRSVLETLRFGINPFANDCMCENENEHEKIMSKINHTCPICGN